MSNLVNHAIRELELIGLSTTPVDRDKEIDMDNLMGVDALELVKVFASQNHSGFSAAYLQHLLSKLLSFESLSPLTDDPDEWSNEGLDTHLQSLRQTNCFSRDGGKTYFTLDDYKWWYTKLPHWGRTLVRRHLPRWFAHKTHTSEIRGKK